MKRLGLETMSDEAPSAIGWLILYFACLLGVKADLVAVILQHI
jgi:hypothetical protein